MVPVRAGKEDLFARRQLGRELLHLSRDSFLGAVSPSTRILCLFGAVVDGDLNIATRKPVSKTSPKPGRIPANSRGLERTQLVTERVTAEPLTDESRAPSVCWTSGSNESPLRHQNLTAPALFLKPFRVSFTASPTKPSAV